MSGFVAISQVGDAPAPLDRLQRLVHHLPPGDDGQRGAVYLFNAHAAYEYDSEQQRMFERIRIPQGEVMTSPPEPAGDNILLLFGDTVGAYRNGDRYFMSRPGPNGAGDSIGIGSVLGASAALATHLCRHPDQWRELADPGLGSARPAAWAVRASLLEAVREGRHLALRSGGHSFEGRSSTTGWTSR